MPYVCFAKCTRLEHWSTDGHMAGVRTIALSRVVEVACINATYIITSPEWESGDVRDSYLQRGFGTTVRTCGSIIVGCYIANEITLT